MFDNVSHFILSSQLFYLLQINVVVPTTMFVEVVSSLMTHQQVSVRKKSVDLLAVKLQQISAKDLQKKEVNVTPACKCKCTACAQH